ncbi:MAG TPA: prolipoprotein diacylglyceryl transferase [Candidatus Binatia bacterium]|nr:prolipoprotein diacylglyceryl transferase [Candidatus Binatia bacterium]
MISSEAFVLSLGLLLGSLVTWAFKRLPDERWQFLASVPIIKDASGRWHGLNFTYYGLFTANALIFGVALLIVLLGSLHVPTTAILGLILAVLLVCLPAAKWVARLVEGKSCTFTVAGAFFVGILVTPALLHFFNLLLPGIGMRPLPLVPALAAVMIAYAFGEGLGRLACISFGCCYGVSFSEAHPILQKFLGDRSFVFSGKMKKISYASGMEGMQVIPIQAMTSFVYTVAGLAATFLFLKGNFTVAFLVAITVTQGWRSLSETLRADYRGGGYISAYQIMGVLAIFLALALVYVLPPEHATTPDLLTGIEAAWHPAVFLFLQGLWGIVFVLFGKSMVTGAEISFHLHHDRI